MRASVTLATRYHPHAYGRMPRAPPLVRREFVDRELAVAAGDPRAISSRRSCGSARPPGAEIATMAGSKTKIAPPYPHILVRLEIREAISKCVTRELQVAFKVRHRQPTPVG